MINHNHDSTYTKKDRWLQAIYSVAALGNNADAQDERAVTVPGATLGDFVLASCSIDIPSHILTGRVSSANTVILSLSSVLGAMPIFPIADYYVAVLKRSS